MANTYIEESLFRDVVIIRMPFPPDPNNTKTKSGVLMVAGISEELLKIKPLEFARLYYQDVYTDNSAMHRQYEVPVIGEVVLVSEFDEMILKNKIKKGDYVTLENCELNAIGIKEGYVYFSLPFRAVRGKPLLSDALEVFEKYRTGDIFTKNDSINALAEALADASKEGVQYNSILNTD